MFHNNENDIHMQFDVDRSHSLKLPLKIRREITKNAIETMSYLDRFYLAILNKYPERVKSFLEDQNCINLVSIVTI